MADFDAWSQPVLADMARELWAEVQRLQQVEQALRDENRELRQELLQLYRRERER